MDYPYLYFPAPDVAAIKNINSTGGAGSIANSAAAILKYSVCVKTCPVNDTTIKVDCHEPSFFSTNTKYFRNCQYYPGEVS
jgi:hypothetical protein